MSTPVSTTNIALKTAVSDEVIVNRNGSTGVQATSDLALQLASSWPLQISGNAGKLFPTAAALAATAYGEFTPWVYADPDVSKNGLYRWNGGGWEWSLPLPYGFLIASNVGAGTPAAIKATTLSPVSTAALILLPIAVDYAGEAATVSFNGGTALAIKTNRGENVLRLDGGSVVYGVISGETFRLANDEAIASLIFEARDEAVAAEEGAQLAQAAAEAARDVAAGYASDAISGGMEPGLSTVMGMGAITIPAGINHFHVAGYYAAGDGGGALYVKVDDEPVHTGKFQTADGAWWELAKGQDIHVEMFGARPLSQSELIARAGSVAAEIAANETAFVAATDFISLLGGGRVYALGQFYVMSNRYERPSGVYIIGFGVGEWEPIYTQRPKTWTGTTLLFKGGGTKDVTFDGITSMRHGGGWRENPDSLGTYFKLWSAYNADAAGTVPATKRQFSAAVMVKENVRYGGFQHLRIANWIGVDGISDWSNPAQSSLGDDWSFGYLIRNGEYVDDYNIQVVGGWREFAHLSCVTAIQDSAGERNRVRRAKFQGVRGQGVRAPDRWALTATTANSVQIYFSGESYWSPIGGTFRGSDNITYTYTGLSQAGTALTLTGVAPDPSSLFHIRHPSSGVANTEYEDCYSYGLDHVSGSLAPALGYPDTKPLEISGFPLRGVKFTNCKFHSREKVLLQIHDAQDILFMGPQFEGGGLLIASPQSSEATYVPAPVGETRNLRMFGDEGTPDMDLRLFLVRGGVIQSIQIGPSAELNGNLRLRPIRAGRDAAVENFNATAFVRAYSGGTVSIAAGGAGRMQFFASGSVAPGADNAQAFGTSAFRWSQIYAGTAAINTSDEREKTDIAAIREAVLDAWGEVGWSEFLFRDAVEMKGEGARIHFGLIVQRVISVFEAHNLDPFRFALLCHDKWDSQPEIYEPIYDIDGNEIGNVIKSPGVPSGDRYGLRYDEALAIEAAYQRRRMDRIEQAIASLTV